MEIEDKQAKVDLQPSSMYAEPTANTRLGVCFEPGYIAKSLEEGVADLIESAQTEEQEANWLYLHNSGMWQNLSYASFEEVMDDGALALGIISKLPHSAMGKRASDYHTHPRALLEKDASFTLEKISSQYQMPAEVVGKLRTILRKASYVIGSLPSFGDIEDYLDLILDGSGTRFDFFVVSPKLVSQIKIDPERAEELANNRAEERYKELQKEELQLTEQRLRAYQTYPVINLAEDLCRRINQEIPGIELIVRAHPGNLAYRL